MFFKRPDELAEDSREMVRSSMEVRARLSMHRDEVRRRIDAGKEDLRSSRAAMAAAGTFSIEAIQPVPDPIHVSSSGDPEPDAP